MTDNKYIAVTYKLCLIEDERLIPIEEATQENPFVFISGFGFTLNDFENNIVPLEKGEKFDFVLLPEQAYGIIDEDNIFELNRELFCIDGKFDEKNIFIDAIIPMRDENGQLFRARVDDITDDKVKLDFNHPLAGKTLNFIGSVLEKKKKRIKSFVLHSTCTNYNYVEVRPHLNSKKRKNGFFFLYCLRFALTLIHNIIEVRLRFGIKNN